MAEEIEFYIPRKLRVNERYVVAGPATIIVFPIRARVGEKPQSEMNSKVAERRSNPRGGLFTRIEDATYNVLRRAKRETSSAKDVNTWDRDCV